MLLNSEIVYEGEQKITIVEIQKVKKPSSYTEGNYTLVFIKDKDGRKITAAGRWVENWKIGDEVEGLLQEKAIMQGKSGNKKPVISSSLFLKNPDAKY